VNKLDVKWKENETELALTEYYDLGIGTVIGISAKKERNLTEIQEQIEKLYKQRKKQHLTNEPLHPLLGGSAKPGGLNGAI
jgi:predicted GTPase